MGRLQRKKNPAKAKKKIKKNLVNFDSKTNLKLNKKKKNYTVSNKNKVKSNNNPFNFISIALNFLKESKSELKKVVWPSRKQTIASTFVVIVIVCLISVFLGLIDAGLSSIVKLVLK
jgi:preprotein translocase subunit SecE